MDNRKTLRLVKKAMRGSDSAFLELMKIKQRDLLYIAIQIMRNKQDGEDAAQEAALIIRAKITTLRSAEAFTVWMYKVVNTVCMNMKRNMKLDTFDIDEMDSGTLPHEDRREFLPSEYALDKELRNEVLSSLNELPEKQRISILLYYYEGLKYHEIADVMNTNVQDVANSLARGKKKLKESLKVDVATSGMGITKNQVGALPVIALILKDDAEGVVTPAMCQAFTGKLIAASGIASGGVASTAALTKVAASIIVGLTVVAGGITAFSEMTQNDDEAIRQAEQDNLPAFSTSDDSENESKRDAIDEDIAALTLPGGDSAGSSDRGTIGEAYDRFVDSGQTEDSWNDFADEVKAQYFSHIVGAQYRFDVYRIPIETNRPFLTVIARVDGGGRVDLAFKQINEQDIPRQKDIVRAFEDWRK